MIITTVSTIKDSLDNFDKFVERNLSSGVDVLFTFLDAPCKEITSKYTSHPNVVVVEAYGDYWKDIKTPKNLNQRQKINANIVNSYLSHMNCKAWLFHIDGDEQISIDKKYLFALSNEIDYVRLEPFEYCPNVSPKLKKQLFKRKLIESELQLLYCLKYIEAPSNLKFFNGHLVGKPGIKVDYKKTIDIHKVHTKDNIQPYSSNRLEVLHYEALNKDDFVRKKLVPSTNSIAKINTKIRLDRKIQLQAIDAVNKSAADKNLKIKLLGDIYCEFYLKKEIIASDLGYLVERPIFNNTSLSSDEKNNSVVLKGFRDVAYRVNKEPYRDDKKLEARIAQFKF